MGVKRIDEGKVYRVLLKNKVTLFEKNLYPGKWYEVKGKHLKQLLEQEVVEEWH